MGLIEKYINFASKNCAKFLRTPVFFRVIIRPLNLCRQKLKLQKTKYEKTKCSGMG